MDTSKEWKVEWLDAEGVGHQFDTTSESVVNDFVDAIKNSPLCMLDVYVREVSPWKRL